MRIKTPWKLRLLFNRVLYKASMVAQSVKSLPAIWVTWVWFWVGKIPWRSKWQLTLEFLPGEFHGQRSLGATVHGVTKESDTTEWLTFTSSLSGCFILLETTAKQQEMFKSLMIKEMQKKWDFTSHMIAQQRLESWIKPIIAGDLRKSPRSH